MNGGLANRPPRSEQSGLRRFRCDVSRLRLGPFARVRWPNPERDEPVLGPWYLAGLA